MPFPWLEPQPRTPPAPPPSPPPPSSTPPNTSPAIPFLAIQTHLNSFLSLFSNSSTFLTSRLHSHAQRLLLDTSSFGRLPWARLSPPEPARCFDLAMSTQAIEERFDGVPVYALSNSSEEFVLVSGTRTGKSLGLFCFKKEDAEALLEQMKFMNRDMRHGSKVVALALNKVFQLKVDGVAFRFVPDSSQVANAIKEKEKAGEYTDGFSGVPVFQSRSLVLKSQNKRYRPVFFRKEDLEDSLFRASRDQRQLNPALRKGDIQVCVLEEIIQAMTEGSASKWDDVVFIPPGFNVSTSIRETARG